MVLQFSSCWENDVSVSSSEFEKDGSRTDADFFSDDQQMHLPQQPPNSNFVQTHNQLSSQKE